MTWPTKDDFADGDVLTAAQVNNIADNLNLFDPTSATANQLWVADGAGSGSFQTVSAGALTLLNTTNLASQTSVDITGIASTYQHLYVVMTGLYAGTTSVASGRFYTSGDTYNGIGHWQTTFDTQTGVTTECFRASTSDIYGMPANAKTVSTTTNTTTIIWKVHNYADASTVKVFDYWKTDAGHMAKFMVTTKVPMGAISRVYMAFSSALTAGTFRLYGEK